MIKVAIVDDDPIILASVQGILEMEDGFQCVLSSQSLDGFFRQAPKILKIDILLLDIGLDGQNSLDYLPRILGEFPQLKIILLTGFAKPDYMLAGMKQGIAGYLLKGSPPRKLVEAMKTTMEGGAYLEPRLAGAVVKSFRESQPGTDFKAEIRHLEEVAGALFNRREREVAAGLLDGQSYKEIAAKNNMSINTVRHYIKTIYRKLNISSRQELIRPSRKE